MKRRYLEIIKAYAVAKPPLTNFFPNLHTLHWREDSLKNFMEGISPFMLPNVRSLTVTLSRTQSISSDRDNGLFELIASRIPGLLNLAICCGYLCPGLVKEIQEAFRGHGFQSLERISIPQAAVTTSFLKILSGLPRLVEITCPKNPAWNSYTLDEDDFNLDASLKEGAFPELSTLTLVRTVSSTLQLLKGVLPPNLQKVCIEALTPEPAASTRRLLEQVKEICPPLSSLQFSDVYAINDSSDHLDYALNFGSLKPLMFSNLKNFQIYHSSPLTLTDSDIEELTSSLPLLEICILNHEPRATANSLMIPTLTSIYTSAENCPNIQTLGLFLNADIFQGARTVPKFRALKSLLMGYSPISQPTPAAVSLSRILPADCDLDIGDPFYGAPLDVWRRVKDVLPCLVSAQVDEVERTECMLKRVHSLEAEIEFLRKQHK